LVLPLNTSRTSGFMYNFRHKQTESMKKYLSILNVHSLLVLLLCLLSSYVCLQFRLKLYIDFLILGIVIVFPLTFSLRMAFRRRERALEYLSRFKAAMQSLAYVFGNSKLDVAKKQEFNKIAADISDKLIRCLGYNIEEPVTVQNASHEMYVFIQTNLATIKRRLSAKVLLFAHRTNESVEFLLATKRHRIPWAPKFIVLVAIYSFVIFYPAGLLNKTGFDVPLWYVFAMTGFKAFLLISFYNVQGMLENPFNQDSPDGIRVNDFRFANLPEPVVIIEKKEKLSTEETKLEEEESE